MATFPTFSLTDISYYTYILSVTITSLSMIILGGWITNRFQKGGLRFGFANKSTLHRKFFGFLLFIVAIFLTGFLSERLQKSIFDYMDQHVAQSIGGVLIAFLIAWFMYDWLVWHEHNK